MATTTKKTVNKTEATVTSAPVPSPIKKAVRQAISVGSEGEVALPETGTFFGYARPNGDTGAFGFQKGSEEGTLAFYVTLYDASNPGDVTKHRTCGLTIDEATGTALQEAADELINSRREKGVNDSYVTFEFNSLEPRLIKGSTLSWASLLTGIKVRKDIIAPSRVKDSSKAIAEASAVQWENREAARTMRQLANPVEVKATASQKLKELMASFSAPIPQ